MQGGRRGLECQENVSFPSSRDLTKLHDEAEVSDMQQGEEG